jgi:hypothetical protein
MADERDWSPEIEAARARFGSNEFTPAELAEVLRPTVNPMVAIREAERVHLAGRGYDDWEVGLKVMAEELLEGRCKSGVVERTDPGRYRFVSAEGPPATVAPIARGPRPSGLARCGVARVHRPDGQRPGAFRRWAGPAPVPGHPAGRRPAREGPMDLARSPAAGQAGRPRRRSRRRQVDHGAGLRGQGHDR